LIPSINCRTYFNFLFSLKVILSHIKDLRDRMYKFECIECVSDYKNFRSCLLRKCKCKCFPTAHRRQSHVQLELLNFEANDYWQVVLISTAKSKETHKTFHKRQHINYSFLISSHIVLDKKIFS